MNGIIGVVGINKERCDVFESRFIYRDSVWKLGGLSFDFLIFTKNQHWKKFNVFYQH